MTFHGQKKFSRECILNEIWFLSVELHFWSTKPMCAKMSLPSFCLVSFSSAPSTCTNQTDSWSQKQSYSPGCPWWPAFHGLLHRSWAWLPGVSATLPCQRLTGMCRRSRWKGKHVSHSARMWFHPQSLQHGYICRPALELCGSKNGHDLWENVTRLSPL